jgi:hypothetical protein
MPLGLIFDCALLLMLLLLGVRNYRYYSIKSKSVNWPVTQATIEKGEGKFNGPFLSLLPGYVPKSLFGYSYKVEGIRYIGFFAITGNIDVALGEEWDRQEKLNGKNLIVRYDPHHPQRSFVVDCEVLGKQVQQGPDWLPRSLGPRASGEHKS